MGTQDERYSALFKDTSLPESFKTEYSTIEHIDAAPVEVMLGSKAPDTRASDIYLVKKRAEQALQTGEPWLCCQPEPDLCRNTTALSGFSCIGTAPTLFLCALGCCGALLLQLGKAWPELHLHC